MCFVLLVKTREQLSSTGAPAALYSWVELMHRAAWGAIVQILIGKKQSLLASVIRQLQLSGFLPMLKQWFRLLES